MCCCNQPTVNGTPGYSWDGKHVGTYPVAPPALRESDTLLADEPGRCGGGDRKGNGLDSHSFHYRLVRQCGLYLLVAHGGGEERIYISLPNVKAILALDSDTRYWILNSIYQAHSAGERKGEETTAQEYRKAFVDGRLCKRKVRGRDAVKVWIRPEIIRMDPAILP